MGEMETWKRMADTKWEGGGQNGAVMETWSNGDIESNGDIMET